MKDWKKFVVAALVRSLRTFCQTFIGFIAVGAALSEIQWLRALSSQQWSVIVPKTYVCLQAVR